MSCGREVGVARQQQDVVVGQSQRGELLGQLHPASSLDARSGSQVPHRDPHGECIPSHPDPAAQPGGEHHRQHRRVVGPGGEHHLVGTELLGEPARVEQQPGADAASAPRGVDLDRQRPGAVRRRRGQVGDPDGDAVDDCADALPLDDVRRTAVGRARRPLLGSRSARVRPRTSLTRSAIAEPRACSVAVNGAARRTCTCTSPTVISITSNRAAPPARPRRRRAGHDLREGLGRPGSPGRLHVAGRLVGQRGLGARHADDRAGAAGTSDSDQVRRAQQRRCQSTPALDSTVHERPTGRRDRCRTADRWLPGRHRPCR